MSKKPSRTQRFLLGAVLLLFASHAVGDFYAAFYGCLVPYLTDKLNLSLVAVGLLAGVFSLTSNFLQPFVGYLGQISGRRVLISGGIFCAAIGMSFLGTAPSFAVVSLLLLIGGLGVGSFHPCGASLAGESGGREKATALSLYFVGGNVGVMLAPLFLPLVLETRPGALPFLSMPGIVSAGLLWVLLKKEGRNERGWGRQEASDSLLGVFKSVYPICLHVILRFIPITAFFVLLPLYATLCGLTQIGAGRVLALFVGAGAAGMVAGGHMSNHIPRKTLTVGSELAGGMVLFLALGQSGLPFYIILASGAFLAHMAMPLQTLMAQERVPNSASAASGVVMGFAYGVAMLMLIPLGYLGDYWTKASGSKLVGVGHELRIATTFMLIAGIMACFIRSHRDTAC